VILINLLPHREAAKKRRKDQFNRSLAASALLGVLASVLIYLGFQTAISSQQDVNNTLRREIGKLDIQIKEIATLEAEIEALKARQQAVESLQADRNMPVHLLTELVTMLPDGVYITTMSQTGPVVQIRGVAQSQDRVAELLRNVSTKGVWLTKPELAEITASSVALSARDQRRVFNFGMKLTLVNAAALAAQQEALAAASAAKAVSAATAVKK
jgi:type IV pilus assembly protein PilN